MKTLEVDGVVYIEAHALVKFFQKVQNDEFVKSQSDMLILASMCENIFQAIAEKREPLWLGEKKS